MPVATRCQLWNKAEVIGIRATCKNVDVRLVNKSLMKFGERVSKTFTHSRSSLSPRGVRFPCRRASTRPTCLLQVHPLYQDQPPALALLKPTRSSKMQMKRHAKGRGTQIKSVSMRSNCNSRLRLRRSWHGHRSLRIRLHPRQRFLLGNQECLLSSTVKL